jgi:glutathione S-transferase
LLLKRPLGVLNDTLVGRDYLAGNDFTVADLNVAASKSSRSNGAVETGRHSPPSLNGDFAMRTPLGKMMQGAARLTLI